MQLNKTTNELLGHNFKCEIWNYRRHDKLFNINSDQIRNNLSVYCTFLPNASDIEKLSLF